MIKTLVIIPLLVLLSACQDSMLDELRDVSSAEFCAGSRNSEEICVGNLKTLGWDFKDSSQYVYDSNFVEISANKANVKSFDSNFSSDDFLLGTHAGTAYSNGQLQLMGKEDSSLDIRNILSDRVDDLVGYWRFEGDFTNEIQAGDTPSIGTGALNSSSDPKVGTQSAKLDGGGSSQVSISNIFNRVPSIKEGSVVTWIRPSAVAGLFFQLRYDADNHIQMLMSGGDKIRMVVEFNNSYKYCDYTMDPYFLDKWLHVGITWNGDNANADGDLYINGQKVCGLGDAGAYPVGSPTSFNIANSLYNGELDEYAYFTKELTSDEINKVYKTQSINSNSHSELWTPEWNSLVGLWSFDGHYNDGSGNGNELNPTGILNFNEGKVGSASTEFSGTGGRLKFSNNSEYSDGFSIGGWIKAAKSGEWQVIASKGDGTNMAFQLAFQSNGTFLCRYFNGGVNKGVANSVGEFYPFGVWRHVMCIYDSETQSVNLFIDGKLVESRDVGGVAPPPSANTSDQVNFGQNFLGEFDSFGLWNTGLKDSEVNEIYERQKQKFGASYTSPVLNLGGAFSWTNLLFNTPLPFMKEITSTSESTTDYPSIVGDLSLGLVGYWPINESVPNSVSGQDVRDHSGNGNHGDFENSPSIVQSEVFSNALKFDRTNDDALNFGSSPSLDFTGDFTVSFWLKISSYPNVSQDYLIGKGDYNDHGWVIGMIGTATKCSSLKGALYLADGTASYKVCSSKPLPLNRWNNVQMVYSGTNVNFYLNGENVASATGINIPFNDTLDLIAGKRSSNSWHYSGLMDEIAIWDRALTSDELEQVYRRAANRLKYQVRSCDDAACDGDAWIGPDGTSNTYFSELSNNDLLSGGLPTGNVKVEAADLTFTDFVSAPAVNQYFQYRVLFEAEDNALCSGAPCLPQLSSLELSPSSRYFGGYQKVQTKIGLDIRLLKSIAVNEEGSCNVSYQLSRDGVNFYYYGGSSWKKASNETESNDQVAMNENAKAFTVQYPGSKVYLRAYLQSGTTGSCSISDVEVVGY